MIIWNFQILEILIFWKFHFCFQKKIWKYFQNFVMIFFGLETIFFRNMFYLYQLKNFPRFQKSYLENRARSLNMRKLQLEFVCVFETHGIST